MEGRMFRKIMTLSSSQNIHEWEEGKRDEVIHRALIFSPPFRTPPTHALFYPKTTWCLLMQEDQQEPPLFTIIFPCHFPLEYSFGSVMMTLDWSLLHTCHVCGCVYLCVRELGLERREWVLVRTLMFLLWNLPISMYVCHIHAEVTQVPSFLATTAAPACLPVELTITLDCTQKFSSLL